MLFSAEHVKANIRNRDGKRVFYLASGDTLSPSARDYLTRERIEILPAQQAKPPEYRLENGGFLREKPENYTHLRNDILVPKSHPVIAFRGAMDTLQATLLQAQLVCDRQRSALGEILALARNVIRWDVLQEPAHMDKLLGLTDQEIRERSHFPQKYYGVPHFMPQYGDGPQILQLNICRCAARAAELTAAQAFGENRLDLQRILNRMSSALYILMIQTKKEG
jgi:ethanolamine utilization cobalamin adenosyltransferase